MKCLFCNKNVKDDDAMRKLQDWRKEYARPFNNLRDQGWSPVEQLTADMSNLKIGSELASLGVPPGAPNLPPLQPLPISEQKQEAEPVPYKIQDLVDAQEAANIQGNLLNKMTESFTEVQDDTSKNMLLIVEKLKQENEALKQQLADQTYSTHANNCWHSSACDMGVIKIHHFSTFIKRSKHCFCTC